MLEPQIFASMRVQLDSSQDWEGCVAIVTDVPSAVDVDVPAMLMVRADWSDDRDVFINVIRAFSRIVWKSEVEASTNIQLRSRERPERRRRAEGTEMPRQDLMG